LSANKQKSEVWIIDTPGIENFGVSDLNLKSISKIFPDWSILLSKFGSCKFSDCKHLYEPQCTLKSLLREYELNGNIKYDHLKYRLNIWKKFMEKLN
jgi:ribosome biogenesis GTPase